MRNIQEAAGLDIINFPEELRVGETRLASAEDLDSLQSEVEVERGRKGAFLVLTIQACEYVAYQRRGRRPFLYRIWKFLQVTATEVIKGESKWLKIF